MKLLIINTIDYQINGIANVINSHVEAYANRTNGIDVSLTFWGQIDEKYNKTFLKNGVILIETPNRHKHVFSYYHSLKQIIRREKFDVVHIHGNSGTMVLEAIAASKSDIKEIIAHVHNSSCSHPLLFGPNSILTFLLKKKCTKKAACSKKAGEWLFKDNFEIIKNSIKLNDYKFEPIIRKQIRSNFAIDESLFVIGHVGLFNQQKNHIFLLNVFKSYLSKYDNSSMLILVGDGPERSNIIEFVKTNNLCKKVILCGKQENTTGFFSAMDIFVFPSLFEGLGIVTIEAQAASLPLIVSSAVPIDEIKCTSAVIQMDLACGFEKWADEIHRARLTYKERNHYCLSDLEKCGYGENNIKNSLERLYFNHD